MAEWFESWFGSSYLEVYPHRNDTEAGKQVEFLLRRLNSPTHSPALDIACGSGRHLHALSERGVSAVGIDLSFALLREAQKRGSIGQSVARADMRVLPFKSHSFCLALSMFTSFGYFRNTDDHQKLLNECKRILQPSGTFVLDYLNCTQAINNLVPHSRRETNSLVIEEQRSILGGNERIEKVITITNKETNEQRKYQESVALFSHQQLTTLLSRAGLREIATFGDFDGAALADSSPRCIVFSESTP